jgi:histidine triad (HIT) family protein
MDCIFCKIVAGEIPSTKVYEDDLVYAFKDIDPKAPIHVLIVPKKHVESLSRLDDGAIVGHIAMVVKQLADELGIAENGYRLVCNTGKNGGQTVDHLHFHLLGGRSLEWPPG